MQSVVGEAFRLAASEDKPTEKGFHMLSKDLVDDEPRTRLRKVGAPPCVLHVEDDQDFSSALKLRLEAHGVAVVRAFDGADAIRQSRKYATDVVLLDFEMPHAKGDEVLKELRENESTKNLPVIMLTGRDDRQLRQRMVELGANGYLTKPLRFEDLRTQLAKHVDVLPRPSLS